MRHGATILWAVLATVAGTGLFMLKYQVQGEEQRLRHIQKQIVQTEEEIHVLKAEWSYLNEPTRLRELAERNLAMHPMKATQLSSIESFGMAPPRPDDQSQQPGNQLAEDQQQPQAAPVSTAPVSTAPEPEPDQSLPQAPQMARPLQQAPMPGMSDQAPVRSFDVKAVVPAKSVPAVKAIPAAVKTPVKPVPKAVLKTAAAKTAAKPVTVAANIAPAPKPAMKSSYPSIYPTYASYPTSSAPVATQASAPGNVMVITSPALGGR